MLHVEAAVLVTILISRKCISIHAVYGYLNFTYPKYVYVRVCLGACACVYAYVCECTSLFAHTSQYANTLLCTCNHACVTNGLCLKELRNPFFEAQNPLLKNNALKNQLSQNKAKG